MSKQNRSNFAKHLLNNAKHSVGNIKQLGECLKYGIR